MIKRGFGAEKRDANCALMHAKTLNKHGRSIPLGVGAALLPVDGA